MRPKTIKQFWGITILSVLYKLYPVALPRDSATALGRGAVGGGQPPGGEVPRTPAPRPTPAAHFGPPTTNRPF